ncbi:putative RNMT-activating mini protein, partial [Triplophysa rosa]
TGVGNVTSDCRNHERIYVRHRGQTSAGCSAPAAADPELWSENTRACISLPAPAVGRPRAPDTAETLRPPHRTWMRTAHYSQQCET